MWLLVLLLLVATQKLELRLSKTTARLRLTNERIMQRDRTGAMVEKRGSRTGIGHSDIFSVSQTRSIH